jgi:hypothetical protein
VNAGASFTQVRGGTQVSANGASMLRHYSEMSDVRSVGHSAGVGLSTRLPGRTTFLVNQAAAYSPTYLYGLFPTGSPVVPGDATTTTPDFAVSDLESYTYTTTASLSHDFTRRNSFSAIGQYRYTDRLRETALWNDVSAYEIRGRYAQGVGRNAGMTTQLRYRSGEYGYLADGLTTEVGLEFGMNYTRPLSATRLVSVRFNIGVSGTDLPQSTTNVEGFQREYLAVGEFGLDYQFSRTWQARANVRRGLEYLSDIPEPVYATGLAGSVDGLLSRRVDVLASAGYSSGQSILSRDSLQFDTYTANARVRYAFSRMLAVYGEYLYYYYDFRGSNQLLPGIPLGLERNGVRVGLTLWVPAVRR